MAGMRTSTRPGKRAAPTPQSPATESPTHTEISPLVMESIQEVSATTKFLPASEFGGNVKPSGTLGPSSTTDFDLPELPMWAKHALAGTLSFLIVTAVVLILAQFPPPLSVFSPLRPRPLGYVKVEQEDHRDGIDERSATNPGYEVEQTGQRALGKSLRKRKNQLSIDTSAEYHGLGIAVPGNRGVRAKVEKRHLHDYDLTPPSAKTTVMSRAGQSFTAPLPSAKTVKIGTPRRSAATDIENSPSTTASPLSSDIPNAAERREWSRRAEAAGSALFERINDGIGRIADKLSKTFYDHVTEPEEGLLLPVHEEERETPLVHGVFRDSA